MPQPDHIIRSNGAITTTEPANGSDYQLEELQAIVGGYIEIVSLKEPNRIMVLNEEGKLHDLPFNYVATLFWQEVVGEDDWVVGDVLICDAGRVL